LRPGDIREDKQQNKWETESKIEYWVSKVVDLNAAKFSTRETTAVIKSWVFSGQNIQIVINVLTASPAILKHEARNLTKVKVVLEHINEALRKVAAIIRTKQQLRNTEQVRVSPLLLPEPLKGSVLPSKTKQVVLIERVFPSAGSTVPVTG